jgi:hypothetical protein
MLHLLVNYEQKWQPEPEVTHLRSPGINSASLCSLAGQYYNPVGRTGPPEHKGWRNRFLYPWNRFLGSLKVHKIEIFLASTLKFVLFLY